MSVWPPPDPDNPARPRPGAKLAALRDIPEPGALLVDRAAGTARFSLILVRFEGGFAGYENRCPHARLPLERPDGRVLLQQGRFLVCAAHGASFRLNDGVCIAGPGLGGRLTPFPVRLDGGFLCAG